MATTEAAILHCIVTIMNIHPHLRPTGKIITTPNITPVIDISIVTRGIHMITTGPAQIHVLRSRHALKALLVMTDVTFSLLLPLSVSFCH